MSKGYLHIVIESSSQCGGDDHDVCFFPFMQSVRIIRTTTITVLNCPLICVKCRCMDTTTDNDYTIMSGSTYAHKLNIENLHRAEMLTVRGEMQCDNVHSPKVCIAHK